MAGVCYFGMYWSRMHEHVGTSPTQYYTPTCDFSKKLKKKQNRIDGCPIQHGFIIEVSVLPRYWHSTNVVLNV